MTTYGSQLASLYDYCKANLKIAVLVAAAAAGVLVFFFSAISNLLTALLWWGVGLKTSEVVTDTRSFDDRQKKDFKHYLAFWAIGMVFEAVSVIKECYKRAHNLLCCAPGSPAHDANNVLTSFQRYITVEFTCMWYVGGLWVGRRCTTPLVGGFIGMWRPIVLALLMQFPIVVRCASAH